MRRAAVVIALAACGPPPRAVAPPPRAATPAAAVERARARAATARTLAPACAPIAELARALATLAPSPPELEDQRASVFRQLAILQHQICADPGSTVDDVREALDRLRDRLADLDASGAASR